MIIHQNTHFKIQILIARILIVKNKMKIKTLIRINNNKPNMINKFK